MKIIFFGTSDFAVPSLEGLVESRYKVLAVVTQPNRKKGRFQQMAAPAVKEAALRLGLPVFQPESLDDKEFVEKLKQFSADLFVVVSYGKILKKEILGIPLKFCINLHGSFLPKYRGAAPINRSIINGDETTGVSVIKMNEKMDEGDIILKKEVPIFSHDTAESLSRRLAADGSSLLLEAVNNIEKGNFKLEKQDDSKATYAPKLNKEDGLINWDKDALGILAHARGVSPWPGAYTYLYGKLIKICKMSIYGIGRTGKPGQIIGIEKDGVLVGTKSGAIVLEEVQPESSRCMDVNAFLAGHKVKVGDMLGK
jgi:methionyl-tRNA formyltransferase